MAVERNMTGGNARKAGGKNLAGLLAFLALFLAALASPSLATIDNVATAQATYAGNPVTSNPASASVPVAPPTSGTVSVVKQGTVDDGGDGYADVGDTINYTFTVTSSGTVEIHDVSLSDPLVTLSAPALVDVAPLGDSSDSIITAVWDVLGPGDQLTFTADYSLIAADLALAAVTNTATATAQTTSGGPLTASHQITTPLTVLASLSMVKTAILNDGGNGIANAGDTIDYSFTVENTGSTTISNVSVSDPLLNMASLPGKAQAFAMMASATNGADPITTASTGPAAPFDPVQAFEGDIPIYAPVATEKIALPWPVTGLGRDVPQIAVGLAVERKLVMLSGDPGMSKTGDRIGIYFELVNTGEGPLTSITAEQESAEAFGSALDILAPNSKDTASIIFTRLLTEADIASGLIAEPAQVVAWSRSRKYVFAVADDLPLAAVGGKEELTTASILPASVPSLAPGDSTVFNATLVLTQAHIDAGVVNNSAEASGNDPLNNVITAPDSASTLLPAIPGLAVIKTGILDDGPDNAATPGDIIAYTFTIKNTGNVTLSGITLVDTLGGVTLAGGPGIATLAPDITDTTTFTATYAITQDDITAGEFQNQASATGNLPPGLLGPDNQPVTTDLSDDASETEDDPTVTLLAPAPAIALIKQFDTSTFPTGVEDVNNNNLVDVGDRVHYTFSVRNTGNVPLQDIYVQDRNPAIIVTAAPPPPGIELNPGGENTVYFTGEYTLLQADVDAGFFDNTADAYGTDPNATIVTDESDPAVYTEKGPLQLLIQATPGIALLKTANPVIADTNASLAVDAGDTITYNLAVYNTGNVTLGNVTLTDINAVESGGPIATLLPGTFDNATFSATHVITAADMTAGEVSNRAHVTATIPGGGSVADDSDPSDITENDYTIVALIAQPSISLVKRFVELDDTDNSSTINVGDTIRYDLDVRNTGNVPLTQVTINEQPGVVVLGGPQIAFLDAGDTDTTTFTAEYVLTATDISNGMFSNLAEATGVAPDLSVVRDDSDETVFDDESATYNDDPTITNLASAAIAVIKSVASIEDVNNNSIDDAGDIIHYAFTVTNTGNAALTNVALTDGNATVVAAGPLNLAVSGANTTNFTATHVITAQDLADGSVVNSATVTADSVFGPVQDLSHPGSNFADSPTVTPLTPAPAVALVKTIASIDDVNGNNVTDPDDVITYTFTIHNTGNAVLSNIDVTDNIPAVVLVGLPVAPLNPGEQASITGTYVVTAGDAETGTVSNTALVTADHALGSVSDDSDDDSPVGSDPTVTAIANPPVVLTKTAAKSEIMRGERLEYTITASNLLSGPYDVTDIMPPGFDFVAGSATVNSSAATPVVSGNVLTFANLVAVDGRITIKLQLTASATLSTGRFVNRARLYFTASGNLLATAEVDVTIKEEHVFDCGEIIGRVFDDVNGNGYADDHEPGLPGVRVVTVKGLLVTTDRKGRFHVPCADVPNAAIGSNYIMKLDTRTLPVGYSLTTENPRVVRLTRGKLTKLNFGATKERAIELEVRRDAFTGGGTELRAQWLPGIDRLVNLLGQGQGKLSIVYRCTAFAPVADARLGVVKSLVAEKWRAAGHDTDLLINARVECGP